MNNILELVVYFMAGYGVFSFCRDIIDIFRILINRE